MAKAILVALAACFVLVAAPLAAQEERERCYGVSLAGENDGIDDREDPGSSTVNYQGNAWAWVPAGECLTMPLPVQPDGTPRRGAPEPLDRDAP